MRWFSYKIFPAKNYLLPLAEQLSIFKVWILYINITIHWFWSCLCSAWNQIFTMTVSITASSPTLFVSLELLAMIWDIGPYPCIFCQYAPIVTFCIELPIYSTAFLYNVVYLIVLSFILGITTFLACL